MFVPFEIFSLVFRLSSSQFFVCNFFFEIWIIYWITDNSFVELENIYRGIYFFITRKDYWRIFKLFRSLLLSVLLWEQEDGGEGRGGGARRDLKILKGNLLNSYTSHSTPNVWYTEWAQSLLQFLFRLVSSVYFMYNGKQPKWLKSILNHITSMHIRFFGPIKLNFFQVKFPLTERLCIYLKFLNLSAIFDSTYP